MNKINISPITPNGDRTALLQYADGTTINARGIFPEMGADEGHAELAFTVVLATLRGGKSELTIITPEEPNTIKMYCTSGLVFGMRAF